MKERINFGCGQFPLHGWVNVDVDPRARAEVHHDLEQFPYPFESGSADEILASHVLEHLHQPFAAMAEFARIVRPGGTVRVKVPHCSRGFTHPDHKRGFDVSFPLYFKPGFQGGYAGTELDVLQVRLRWFAQPEFKRQELGAVTAALAAACGRVIDLAAMLSPTIAARVWCYWVGGFEEVEFVFRRPAT